MNGFQAVIGQPQAVELLQQAIAQNRIAPAYLLAGTPGIGRSLVAKCFTEALLSLNIAQDKQVLVQKRVSEGNHPDLLWIEPTYQHQGQLLTVQEAEKSGLKRKAPPQIRIEQIREITQFLSRPPLEASRSVIVIEGAETMTEAAANGLLKTLEEPGKATLILIAPSTDSLLPTLVSRCQKIPFYRLSQTDLTMVLERVGTREILQNTEILNLAQGSPGEAIAAYAQLQAIPEDLRQQLTKLPKNALGALELAKTVTKELDTPAQLWLIDYLQYRYWENFHKPTLLEHLETARQGLLCYVQPRLVWECLLLEIIDII